MPPVISAIDTAKHAGAANAEHGAWPPTTDQYAMHVQRIVVQILTVAQVLPVLAAISGAQRAADLDGCIQAVRLVDAGIEHENSLCRIGTWCRGDLGKPHAYRQAHPALTGIVTAVDLAVLVANEDHVGIRRVEQE